MKRTAIKRKPAKPKRRPAKPCSWSNRCKTRAPIVINDEERYCKSHAAKVAEELVGLFVKERDNWTCKSCGASAETVPIQWAHIVSRGAPYIKYEPMNGFALCAPCHFKFTLKPAQWLVWLEQNYPGLHTRMIHLEITGEARGNQVDIAEIIRDFRDLLGLDPWLNGRI